MMAKCKIVVLVAHSSGKLSYDCNGGFVEKDSEQELWESICKASEINNYFEIKEYNQKETLTIMEEQNDIIIKQANREIIRFNNQYEFIVLLMSHYLVDSEKCGITIFEANIDNIPNYPAFGQKEIDNCKLFFSSFRSDDMYTNKDSLFCQIVNKKFNLETFCKNLTSSSKEQSSSKKTTSIEGLGEFEKSGIWLISKARSEFDYFENITTEEKNGLKFAVENKTSLIIINITSIEKIKKVGNKITIQFEGRRSVEIQAAEVFLLGHGLSQNKIEEIEVADYSSLDNDYQDWWRKIKDAETVEKIFKIGKRWFLSKILFKKVYPILPLTASLAIDFKGLKNSPEKENYIKEFKSSLVNLSQIFYEKIFELKESISRISNNKEIQKKLEKFCEFIQVIEAKEKIGEFFKAEKDFLGDKGIYGFYKSFIDEIDLIYKNLTIND